MKVRNLPIYALWNRGNKYGYSIERGYFMLQNFVWTSEQWYHYLKQLLILWYCGLRTWRDSTHSITWRAMYLLLKKAIWSVIDNIPSIGQLGIETRFCHPFYHSICCADVELARVKAAIFPALNASKKWWDSAYDHLVLRH